MPDHRKFYEAHDGGLPSIDGSKIYFIGIIDIFTYYSTRKKAEHFFKSLKYPELTVSCVPPATYAHRFVEFLDAAFK